MKITNGTHWRTSDIKRVMKSVLDRFNMPMSEVEEVAVEWQTGNASKASVKVDWPSASGSTTIPCVRLFLPKRGPKDHHQNAMLSIACSASQDPNAEVLAFQEVFRFVNILAFRLVDEWCIGGSVDRPQDIQSAVGTTAKPDWAPVETFQIAKYKDPLKDGTYLDFVAKKQKELRRAEADIERETANMETARHRIKLAEQRKKAAEKALRDAKARRT